jgi:hypothetical protein
MLTGSSPYCDGSANHTQWLDPADSPNWRDRSSSVGVDRTAGDVHFTPRLAKQPSRPRMPLGQGTGEAAGGRRVALRRPIG